MKPIGRRTRRWLMRAAGSALFLAVLLLVLPLEAVVAAFRAIPPATFALVLLGFLVAHVAAAMKWRLLLDNRIGVSRGLKAHFAGLAANLCLPGAIGGDAVRAGVAYGSLGNGPAVVAAAAADRLVDLAALLIVSLIGATEMFNPGAETKLAKVAIVLFCAAVVVLYALVQLLPQIYRLAPKLPGRGFLVRLTEALGALARRPLRLIFVLATSIAIQMTLVLLAWWLAVAAGADARIGYWVFAWPLAKVIAVLPISLNGLGMREAALAAFLAPHVSDPAMIVAAGLAWQAVMFAAGLIGGAIQLISREKPAALTTGGSEL